MRANDVIDEMSDIINKCNEYRSQALNNYHRESAILRAGRDKMTEEEYRNARYDNMNSYREETRALCLISIAACEAVIHELEEENPYKAVYTGGEKGCSETRSKDR